MNSKVDVRDVLSTIRSPTLVLHRAGDLDSRVEEGRFIADHIPGARFVELPGDVHVPWVGMNDLLAEVEEFLTGVRPSGAEGRKLATVLFTDIVDSTARVRELGDTAWAMLLGQHDVIVRSRLALHGGVEIDAAGDGFLALFDGPARAIRCGLAVRESVRPLGLEVRAGVHTGEVEEVKGRPRGIAVHVAARVVAAAGAGEVLVTQTTHDLVEGSGLEFEDRGLHEGIENARRLYAAL